MIRRLALAVLVGAVLVTALPPAGAAEQGLAGIRLGQQVMELFNQNPYGPPDFFGPPGAVITWGVADTQPGAPAAPTYQAPAAAGPAAPAFRLGVREDDDDDRRGGAPGYTLPPVMPTVTAPTKQAGGTQMYWLYRMPGGATVVAGFDTEGKVTIITVAGTSYPPAATEGGVRLGDTYLSILDKYGFPDSTAGSGGNLTLRYSAAGLTLRLANLRVTSIILAAPGAEAAAPGRAPVMAGQPAAPVAPGIAPTTGTPAGGVPRISLGRRED